jgi:hypothetical protein
VRARAFTHPLPVALDDEFLDQDVFDQEGLDEGPAGSAPAAFGGATHDGFELRGLTPEDPDLDSWVGDPAAAMIVGDNGVLDASEATVAHPLAADAAGDGPSEEDSELDRAPQRPVGHRDETGRPEQVEHRELAAHAARRGGRHGDKPRMPSWDDILLGVRRKGE